MRARDLAPYYLGRALGFLLGPAEPMPWYPDTRPAR